MATRWKATWKGGSAVQCGASGGVVQSAQTDQRCTMGDSSLNQTSWSSLSLSFSVCVCVISLSTRVGADGVALAPRVALLLSHLVRLQQDPKISSATITTVPDERGNPTTTCRWGAPVKFERWPVEGEDFRSIAHQYEESIYVIHLQLVKKIQQITTACNRLDLKHSGSSVFTDRHRSKNLLGQLTFSTFDPFCTLTVSLTQLECNVQTLFGKNGSKF